MKRRSVLSADHELLAAFITEMHSACYSNCFAACLLISHDFPVSLQVKILAEVDHMIDLEKERLEVDRRDAQIQRAQLAFKLLGQQGS